MEMKIDLHKIQSYSLALAEKLSGEYFQAKSEITGSDILKLTGLEQINLFIIKNLFDKWKEESLKLKSPYFDYEHNEVKEALTLFLNKLSRHIAIRREFFRPLLQKAISDTLVYLLTPYDFISIEYLNKTSITISELKEKVRYVRLHTQLMQQFMTVVTAEGKEQLSGQELQRKFKELYDAYTPNEHEIQQAMTVFSSMLKISIEELTVASVTAAKPTASKSAVTQPSLFSGAGEPSIHQKVQKSSASTLNDILKKDTTTLADRLRRSKVQDLKSSIPLNMKFLFINELFNSMSDEYNKALTQLDMIEDGDTAKRYIQEELAPRFKWDPEKAEVKDFVEMVERKFSR